MPAEEALVEAGKDGREVLSAAVSAAAHLLPRGVPDQAREPIARAMLEVALPLVPQLDLVRQAVREAMDLASALLDLHAPGPADHDNLTVCGHCYWAWPCPTVRLASEMGLLASIRGGCRST